MSGMPDPEVTVPETFRSFAERIVGHAEAQPDRILISEPGRALRAGEFAGLVARLARALEASGLDRGMRMAILATISPEALAVRYAAATLGCVTVFCPNTGDPSRLRRFLGTFGQTCWWCFPGRPPRRRPLCPTGRSSQSCPSARWQPSKSICWP